MTGEHMRDFIEVEYTGKTTEEKFIFDTTDEAIAKKEGIYSPKTAYGPVVVSLGSGQLLPGLDLKIAGKQPGTYTINLSPEEGFGKKSAKLIQLVPTSKFRKEQIMPHPGLQVNIDGQMGTVKTVSGGRTLVDFNHPLSGKELEYEVTIKRIVTDKSEKLSSVLSLQLGLKDPEIHLAEDKATVSLPEELPKEIAATLSEELKKMTGISTITFKKKEKKSLPEQTTTPKKTEPKSSENKQ